MGTNLTDRTVGLMRKNKRKHIWYRVVSAMACVVVFCTTYALILPAITLTESYYCGLQAHTHTEDCYHRGPGKISICEAQPHVHQVGCYGENSRLLCGAADFFLHTHSEICYDGNGLLVCQMEERCLHTHADECYMGDTVYSCGRTAGESHFHGDECYEAETGLICQQQEQDAHRHEEGCYGVADTLVCTREECEGHCHTDACYDIETTLVCELDGLEGHVHAEECYFKSPKLLCELEEYEGHIHEEPCYMSRQTLLCGLEENDGHVHTEEVCFGEVQILSCSIQEGVVHEHDENCALLSEPVLVCNRQELVLNEHTSGCRVESGAFSCGKLAAVEHIHGEACFQPAESRAPELMCQRQEHTHQLACTSDRSANLETAEIWRTTVPSAETLTGSLAENLVAVAESQMGYQESSRNFEVAGNDKRKGYTRYGQWYGDPYGDWCAMYVSFCLHYAGISEELVPYNSNCPNWVAVLTELGLYRTAEEYTPVPGDIVFFGAREDRSSHVGIVKAVTEEEIITIEGNTSNRVDSNSYRRAAADSPILGYCSMEAVCQRGIALGLITSAEEKGPVEVQLEAPKVIELEADYGDVHIRLIAPTDAFPVTADNLTLVVTEPAETIRTEIAQRMGEDREYLAVDIEILCDGVPIQPNGEVQVIFESKNALFPNSEEVEIFHAVEDENHEILDMREVEGGYDENGNVVMEANHFSTYVVTGAEAAVVPYAAGAAPTNTWEEALTDRSSYIGVESEGYADSPYTKTRQFKGTNITALTSTGGTVYVGGDSTLQYAYYAETFWDGTKPVRITTKDAGEQNRLIKSFYSDWILEDTVDPYGALKIDNVELKLNTAIESQKFELYGRGNKIVIGENVNTDHIMAHSPGYIYGGSRTNDSTTSGFPTNVVVTSGRWGLVMGGGGADVNDGTQVTIRDTAEVGIIYGGGIEKGDVNKGSSENATNVYIEGGRVGEVYGGNQTTTTGIKVNGDINIDVSGGQVITIHAGNDHRGVEDSDELKGSKVRGGAVVNIYNTGSVTNLIGDYLHYDSTFGDQLITLKSATGNYTMKGRHIQNLVELNVHSSNNFGMMDYWDIVRINNRDVNAEPNSVVVSSTQDLVGVGNATANIGSMYIGRMEVTNGGKFYLKNNGFINYMNEVSTSSEEGVQSFDLKHAWMGESSEERRAWSTLAIEGSCIKASTADTNLFTLKNPCDGGYAGLRIKGNVEGFSTLEACGTPMYSTGDTYYYYVVADSSDNGGKAFKEPEGAPYVVCYRYLDDGRIGWYLRERPTLTMYNSLVRVGTNGELTLTDNGFYTSCPEQYMILFVDMKGFAYEWNSNPSKNHVEFSWTIADGTENTTVTTGGITINQMADIANNLRTTSNPNGIFANVQYETDANGVTYVSDFVVVIDTSEAVNPRYYSVDTDFHYIGTAEGDDIRAGQTADAARCTYDFAKDGEKLGNDGYANSVMTTYEYKDGIPPKGEDDALLRVYLPEGVAADTLTVKELDDQFTFENTGKAASLVSNSQVAQYYSTEEESTYNHLYAVTLQQEGSSEVDLAGGATLSSLSGKETYNCTVYSHEKINFTDITPESDLGLQLQLQLNDLTKNGNAVGNGDPAAVNHGELRIQVLPVGTIIDTTTVTVEKLVEGDHPSTEAEFDFLLSYPKNDGTHEERFTLKHGETKTFIVPLETQITVQEIDHDGYFVRVDGRNQDTFVFTTPDTDHLTEQGSKVTFYNTPGAEMPSTGGISARNHTLLGLLLMMGALLLWMHRRERRAVR